MIDTHAHYNSAVLNNLKEEIIKANEITYFKKIINVGLDYNTSDEAIEISKKDKFYATIGVHPLYEGNVDDLINLYDIYNYKIVAVGETGLDYIGDIKKQTTNFIKSIFLANFLKLPLIIHANNTNQEVLKILKKYKPEYGFVFHCFQPDLEILDEIVSMNGYISVTTPITRINANKSIKVVERVPIDNILIETDFPFMTEKPIAQTLEVLNRISFIKDIEPYILAQKLDSNAKRLFYKL